MIRLISKIIALIMLIVLIVPAFMYFSDCMSLEIAKNIMFLATVTWFITASIWMWNNDSV